LVYAAARVAWERPRNKWGNYQETVGFLANNHNARTRRDMKMTFQRLREETLQTGERGMEACRVKEGEWKVSY
jgi:hypothetical protein